MPHWLIILWCKIIDVWCNLPPGGPGTTMFHFVVYFQPWILPRTHKIRSLLCSKIESSLSLLSLQSYQYNFTFLLTTGKIRFHIPLPFTLIWSDLSTFSVYHKKKWEGHLLFMVRKHCHDGCWEAQPEHVTSTGAGDQTTKTSNDRT